MDADMCMHFPGHFPWSSSQNSGETIIRIQELRNFYRKICVWFTFSESTQQRLWITHTNVDLKKFFFFDNIQVDSGFFLHAGHQNLANDEGTSTFPFSIVLLLTKNWYSYKFAWQWDNVPVFVTKKKQNKDWIRKASTDKNDEA